jgi:drug/metabolite transporter (DMT)-like permease
MLLWGLSFVASKTILNTGVPPMTMVCLRYLLTTIILNVLLRLREPPGRRPQGGRPDGGEARRRRRLAKGDVLPLLASGLVGVTVYFFFESRGIKLTTASHASLIIAAIPVFTLLAEMAFFGTRVRLLGAAGVALSVAGVVLVVWSPGTSLFSGFFTGDLFMFGACFSWVAYILLSKNLHTRLSDLAITTYQSLFGTIFLIPLALLEYRQWVPLGFPAIGSLLYLAVLSSAVGNFLYVYALSRLGPISISPYLNLIPVVGVIGGIVLQGDRVAIAQEVGGAVIIAGVLMVNWRQRLGSPGEPAPPSAPGGS